MGNQIYSSSSDSALSFTEARQYVSDEEYDRLRRAFTRFKKGGLNFEEFNHHVLGGAQVPHSAQLLLFSFFSRGAESLSFENLFCALVGICRVEQVQATFVEDHPDFRSWGLVPPMLTAPVNDAYISFYEVMSYVTHLTVDEVRELEKVFATINDRGPCKISKENWEAAAGGCFPSSFTSRLFSVFDENRNELIDFREMVCGVSAMCRGPKPSRLSFLAKLWDFDGDNLLSDDELLSLYEGLKVPPTERTIVKSRGDKAATVDFATWALGNTYADDLCQMALEMGHICLGLRPESHEVEFSIVSSLLARVRHLPLPEWNIVSAAWYRDWGRTVSLCKRTPPINNRDIGGIKEDNSPSSMVACLSAESACLRSDIQPSEFIAVPPSLWRAFLRWHGSQQSVDGQFTRRFLPEELSDDGRSGLELFPLDVLVMRHDKKRTTMGREEISHSPWAYAQVSRSLTVGELLNLCKSELRLGEEEARLWTCPKKEEKDTRREEKDGIRLSDVSKESKISSYNGENLLLDEPECTLYELGLSGGREVKLLLELRDKSTGVWPEEARAAVSGTGTVGTARREEGRPGAVGLVNFGNFCYRNAAVQCLARVSPLTEYLLEPANIARLQKLEQTHSVRATLEYALLLREIWTTNKKNISPIDFNDAIRESQIFVSGEQHDCQEFVNFLIEQMASTLCEKLGAAPSIASETAKAEKTEEVGEVEKATKAWQHFLEQNNSLVCKLFAGQLKSSLVCKQCRASSSVFEPFTSLSLPIGFDNVELYQVIVVPRDGAVPTRFGFRLPRDANVSTFKTVIADASGIRAHKLTMLCMSNKGSLMRRASLSDSAPITNFPSGARVYAMELPDPEEYPDWVVTIHRKLQYNYEPYFLGSTSGFDVNIFGVPIIVPCSENVTGHTMYEDVWRQMRRFMDAPPLPFSSRATDPCEDASSGYPFALCVVDESLQWCGQCPALKFCRGCPIRPDDTPAHIPEGTCVAVDWIPTALYLRYNHSQETNFVDDCSVGLTWERHYSPSSLEACLAKFSCPETLDALIDCSRCGTKTRRDKVLSIWTLPRYLIIQLKRFEYLREEGRIGKCRRVVDFPLSGFDPAPFVDGGRGIEGRARYDCIAIANHYGQLESGHFLSYARSDGGNWLLLNDCSVKEVSDDEVDKRNAYLLFYERKDPN